MPRYATSRPNSARALRDSDGERPSKREAVISSTPSIGTAGGREGHGREAVCCETGTRRKVHAHRRRAAHYVHPHCMPSCAFILVRDRRHAGSPVKVGLAGLYRPCGRMLAEGDVLQHDVRGLGPRARLARHAREPRHGRSGPGPIPPAVGTVQRPSRHRAQGPPQREAQLRLTLQAWRAAIRHLGGDKSAGLKPEDTDFG